MAVGFIGLVVKLAATFKELIIARTFGRGDEVDAFLIAFVLPAFVLNIGMSALGYALVPVFVETGAKEGKEAAQRLLSSMMLLGVVALAGVGASTTLTVIPGEVEPEGNPLLPPFQSNR